MYICSQHYTTQHVTGSSCGALFGLRRQRFVVRESSAKQGGMQVGALAASQGGSGLGRRQGHATGPHPQPKQTTTIGH